MFQKTALMVLLITLVICSYKFYQEREVNRDLVFRLENLEGTIKSQIAASKLMHEELYSFFSRDKNGKLPTDVLNAYLQARIEKNPKAMYELMQVPVDITFNEFEKSVEIDGSVFEHYIIEDFILYSKDTAVVFLTYKNRVGNKTFSYNWEPWACVNENDVWKVRWLPRQ